MKAPDLWLNLYYNYVFNKTRLNLDISIQECIDMLEEVKGQVFVNAFGEMFEDYFEELMGEYLKNGFWHKIPENKKKSADYYVEFCKFEIRE